MVIYLHIQNASPEHNSRDAYDRKEKAQKALDNGS